LSADIADTADTADTAESAGIERDRARSPETETRAATLRPQNSLGRSG